MDGLLLAATGPIAALVFAGAQKLFRAGAQEAAKAQLAEQLRGEFAQFSLEFIKNLNGTYRRTSECELIGVGVSQRLDSIDAKLQQVQTYAHDIERSDVARRERRHET